MDLEKLKRDIFQNGSGHYGDSGVRVTTAQFKTKRGEKSSFLVVIPKRLAGTRVRKQFRTLADAGKWIETWLKGRETTAATVSEAADFNVNLPRLRATGVSISELLDFYEARFIPGEDRKTLRELQEDLERVLDTSGKRKRPRWIDAVQTYGKKVCEYFGGETAVDTIEAQAVLDWIKGMNATGKTRSHYWQHMNRLLTRAVHDGALKANPLDHFKPDEVRAALEHEKAETEVLENEEARKLLDYAAEKRRDVLPITVLGLFAGLRQSEAAQITWESVDLENGFVTVPRAIAKGRNIRHAKLCGQAVAWLRLCPEREGKISKGDLKSASNRWSRFVKNAGFERWPHNALRHTFASNYYALEGAEKTRSQIGHTDRNERQLFENYRALVTEADARAFFEIEPEADIEPVPFPKAATA